MMLNGVIMALLAAEVVGAECAVNFCLCILNSLWFVVCQVVHKSNKPPRCREHVAGEERTGTVHAEGRSVPRPTEREHTWGILTLGQVRLTVM